MIGPLADDAQLALGSWAAPGGPEDAITRARRASASALPHARVLYARGAPVDTVEHRAASPRRSARRATADAVLLVLGERDDMSGEAASRASIELPGSQLAARAGRRARVRARAGQAGGRGADERPAARDPVARRQRAGHSSRRWFLGVEHGHARRRRAVRRLQPGGKLPVTLPARHRPGADLLRPQAHRPSRRSERAATPRSISTCPWTPLCPVRPRAELHDVRATRDLRLSRRQPFARATPSRSTVDVTNTGTRAGRRGRAALPARRRRERHAAACASSRGSRVSRSSRARRARCGSRCGRRTSRSTI